MVRLAVCLWMTCAAWASAHAQGARLVPQVGHRAPLAQLQFTPSEAQLLSLDVDGAVGAWDVATGALVLWLPGSRADRVLAVHASEDEQWLRTVTSTGEVASWKLSDGSAGPTLSLDTEVTSAVFASARFVVTLDEEGTATTWDATTAAKRRALRSSVTELSADAVSADGKWAAARTGEGSVGLFKVKNGKQVRTFDVGDAALDSFALSPDGTRLLTVQSSTATLWDAKAASPLGDLTVSEEGAGEMLYAAFTPGGSPVTVERRNVTRIWNAENRTEVARSPEQTLTKYPVAVAADGRVASGLRFGGVGLHTPGETELEHLLADHVRASTTISGVQSDWFAMGHEDGTASLWDIVTGTMEHTFQIGDRPVDSVTLTPLTRLLATTDKGVAVFNHRLPMTPLVRIERFQRNQRRAALSFDNRTLITENTAGKVEAWSVPHIASGMRSSLGNGGFVTGRGKRLGDANGRQRAELMRMARPAPHWLRLADDGSLTILGDDDEELGSVYVFAEGGWAVVDREGRFDTHDDVDVDGLVWVIDGRPYDLSQLRDRYYDPGLFAKLRGLHDEPLRDVPPLSTVKLPPVVHASGPSPAGMLEVRLEDRGGGIGALHASLNGSHIASFVEDACPELYTGASCTVDLSTLPTWLPGAENRIRLEATDGGSLLRSRGLDVIMESEGTPVGDPPDFWVLTVGTGDYAADDLDLTYAGKDAISVGRAMALAGGQGFGDNRTHLRVLSTTPGDGVYGAPDKQSVLDAFTWLSQADPLDTVVVFFSGHGASHTDGEVDDYFYMLPSAGSFADLNDPELRKLRALSGTELADAMATIPAFKRVVVLDTCAAGKVEHDLTASRSLSSDAVRAHARARERTGAWLLAGAAADKVSYEASRFGQGVLTYSLLEGMRGPALDDADLLMVSRLLAHAEQQVPKHAQGVGGVQQPITRRGSSDDFPLGQLAPDTRGDIDLRAVRPVVVRSAVVGQGGRRDTAGCTDALNAALRDHAHKSDGVFVYWDSDPVADTWQVTGACWEASGTVRFEGFLTRSTGPDSAEEQPLNARSDRVQDLARQLVGEVSERVGEETP
ncbi:MAG: caspase family protein [Myxococcales bacterium]|nr:caspase family protein [Myxococcales bacterium]